MSWSSFSLLMKLHIVTSLTSITGESAQAPCAAALSRLRPAHGHPACEPRKAHQRAPIARGGPGERDEVRFHGLVEPPTLARAVVESAECAERVIPIGTRGYIWVASCGRIPAKISCSD